MTVYQHQHRADDFQAPEVSPKTGASINFNAGETSRVIVRDGVLTSETTSAGRVHAGELNPHYGDGTVFATAKNPRGSFVREIMPETLITVDGVQAPVSFWVSQGVVHKTTQGDYAEGPGANSGTATTQNAQKDAPPNNRLDMPEGIAQEVDRALDGVADHHIQPLIATGIGIATGELDRATLVRQMATYSGVAPEEADARVSFMQAAYQEQANVAITNRCGVAAADLGGFYEWAKGTQKGALRDAVQKQVHSSDFSGYRALTARYLAENPPTIEAVAAGGFETRKQNGSAEVFVDGRWMTITVAARLGYF